MYRTICKVFLIGALSAAVMLAIRLLLVEPDDMARGCLAYGASLQCKLRAAAIYGFSRHLFAPISLVAAVLAAIGALRPFAMVAMVAGMAGVVLYDFNLSAIGVLLGALLYLRFSPPRQVGDGEQHAQPTPH